MKNKSIKKIAILYSGGRNFGGIEKYLLDLFQNLKNSDIKLELLSLGRWELTDRLEKSGHAVTIFSGGRINPMTIIKIGGYLKYNKFNLLVSQATVANAYARVTSLFYRVPNLVTVHSNPDGDYSNPVVRFIYGAIEKLTRFSTVKYIAVSRYIRDGLIKSGLPADKVEWIYNGVNLPNSVVKKHLGTVIGSIGRLHPVKGYDLLIQAFASLNDKKLRLKIAGEGDELDRLQHLAKSLDVADRVDFIGFAPASEFLGEVDIYVQSSTHEGFGLAVVEAMSCGLPVVVTPVGSLREIVVDGKTGIVSDDMWPESLAKAIFQVIGDKKLATRLGRTAKQFVADNFEIKKWADATAKAYRGAIK